MAKLRIGVLYGGRSGEHEISIASAAAVIANLDRQQYDVLPIAIDRSGHWSVPDVPPASASAADAIAGAQGAEAARGPGVLIVPWPSRPAIRPEAADDRAPGLPVDVDVIFPVLHGPLGEDGTVQGLLELANLPYVGAGVAASAVGMDKALTKMVLQASGLPTVAGDTIQDAEWRTGRETALERIADTIGFPAFVKPANLGSSVGVSKVRSRAELAAGVAHALEFDRKVLVERAVPAAREIECSVLGNEVPEVSVPGEIVPSGEFYDYAAKYLDAESRLLIPAPLPEATAGHVRDLAAQAFRAIDCSGMARVDFLLDGEQDEVRVNEINTIPGFTTISMYPKLWEASGLAYPRLLDRLIALALDRHRAKQHLKTTPS